MDNHPATEEVTHCCLCGSTKYVVSFTNYDRLHRLPGTFELVRCGGCGLVRLSPRPSRSALPAYYPENQYYAFQPINEAAAKRPVADLRELLRAALLTRLGYPTPLPTRITRALAALLPERAFRRACYDEDGFPPYVDGGRALDVGCGSGAFLSLLRRHGWTVMGVDIAPAAAAAVRQLGIDVHIGDIEGLPTDTTPFDFVHMSHVVEHVYDPVRTLNRVRALLKPGGLLYIETPNVAASSLRWCGQYWFPLETPRHLWLFSPRTLCHALGAAGLRVTHMWTKSLPSCSLWDATFRREEQKGARLQVRPTRTIKGTPRSLLVGFGSHLAPKVRWDGGEILGCWARPHPVSEPTVR